MGINDSIQKAKAESGAQQARSVESSKSDGTVRQMIKTANAASEEKQHEIKIKKK